MATTETVPVSVWEWDRGLELKGTSELRGAVAVAADEMWAVGAVVDTASGRSGAVVGRWTRDFAFVRPAAAKSSVRLLGVDGAGDDVWAVGWISDGADGGCPRIERYARVPEPAGVAVAGPAVDRNSELHGVAMLSKSEGWAVGGSGPSFDADLTRTLIARWDGYSWQAVPSPSPGTMSNQLDAVAARTTDDVWAVGHSTSGARPEALVLHWDGLAWEQVPTPDLADGVELLDVAVVGPESVWAVGTSVPEPKPFRQLAVILHWDGSTWRSVLPEEVVVTQMSAVTALSETDVWFAGYAQQSGGPESAHVEHWDGQQLHTETSGVTTRENVATALEGICAPGDRIMAVGWRTAPTSPNQLQQAGALHGRARTSA